MRQVQEGRNAIRLFVIAIRVLAVAGLVAWLVFYLWVQGLACAFVTSGNCRLRWPWELGGEDMRFLVLAPGAPVAALAAAAWLFGRQRRWTGMAALLVGSGVSAWAVATLR